MSVHKSSHISVLTSFPNVLSLLMEKYFLMLQEHCQKRLEELYSKVCMNYKYDQHKGENESNP